MDHHNRVNLVVVDLSWVEFNLEGLLHYLTQLQRKFCQFPSDQAEPGRPEFNANPTKIHDHQIHHVLILC